MLPTEVIEKCNYAIRHYDDAEARKLLPEVRKLLFSNNIRNNPAMFEELKKKEVYLKIVAIPQLSDDESADVLRNNYLESFEVEIDMENRLTAKLFLIPEIPRDDLRRRLKQALIENKQKIGNLTIGEWLSAFEKEQDIKTRTMSACVDFVMTNSGAQILNSVEKERLKETLHVYDYLLVTTLPATGPTLNAMLEMNNIPTRSSFENSASTHPRMAYSHPTEPENSTSKNTDAPIIEKLTLETALKKYPEIGEQLISTNMLSLKSFPEPVRPSIKNWVSDYMFNIGISNRDQMVRMNYLFKNKNAEKLSYQERERLTEIIKSFEENTLLSIDISKKQVVFTSSYSKPLSPEFSEEDSVITKRLSAWRKDLGQQETASGREKAIENQELIKKSTPQEYDAVTFSSPHKLPIEKMSAPKNQPQPQIQPKKIFSNPTVDLSNVQLKTSSNNPPARNIVNLKED